MRSILLLVLGVPIPIIILVDLLSHFGPTSDARESVPSPPHWRRLGVEGFHVNSHSESVSSAA